MRDVGSKPMEFGKQSWLGCRSPCMLNLGHDFHIRWTLQAYASYRMCYAGLQMMGLVEKYYPVRTSDVSGFCQAQQ